MDDDTTQAWKTKEHDNSPDISDLEAGPPLPPPPPPQNVNPYYSPRRTDSWPKAPSSVEPPRVESYRISDTPAMIIRPYSRNSRPHKLSATPEHATGHGDPPFILPVQQQLTQQEHPLSPAKRNDFSSPPPNTLLLDPEIISSAELGSISQPTVRRLPSFMQSTEIHNPNPPEAVIKEVQATRLGTTGAKLAAEAAYQVDIAPPVRRRTPPPAIHIDFGGIPQNPAEEPKYMNHSTWAVPGPEVAGLAPPIGQLPMSSPGTAGYAPPVHQVPMSTPHAPQPGAGATHDAYDVSRPTCSLNLVCYRSGAGGCVLRQVQAVLESRFADKETFRAALAQNPQLVATDAQLFRALRRAYWKEMSGFWRRHLSLKTLRGLRVLAYSPVTRPVVVPLDDFVLQEMYYAYRHPGSVAAGGTEWVEWVFRLRRRNKRHALEFVEGWNSARVVVAATLPWLVSCLVGVVWSATGGDPQTAFTVASFILTSGTVVIALLALVSGIESSGRGPAPLR